MERLEYMVVISAGEGKHAVVVHWGWVTPGVPDCNRKLQEEEYLAFLDGETLGETTFNFTQPGWVLDSELSRDIVALTGENPEPGKHGKPFAHETLNRLREEVEQQRLYYIAYPYAGAIVEGMTGESVLQAYRLTQDVVAHNLSIPATGFFVHDGLTQLDWNAPMIPQIGWLAGFRTLYGRTHAVITSPDGTTVLMVGCPQNTPDFLFNAVELMDAPEQVASIRERFAQQGVSFVSAEHAAEILDTPNQLSCWRTITKGWYGGGPLVMQMQAHLRRTDHALAVLSTLRAVCGKPADLTGYWKRSLILQDCHLQWLLHDLAPHYLPEAVRIEQEVRRDMLQVLDAETSEYPTHLFNPLPFPRSAVLDCQGVKCYFPEIPPLQSVPMSSGIPAHVSATPRSLSNSRITAEFNERGEITIVRRADGTTLFHGSANHLVHRHNIPVTGQFSLKTGSAWTEGAFCGNLRLYTDIDVPEDGEYAFEFAVPRGMTIALGCEDGNWVPATNRHWGGGLPSANRDQHSGHGILTLSAGKHRLCLYGVADEGYEIQHAVLRRNGQEWSLENWQGELVTQWGEDAGIVEQVTTDESEVAASVTFVFRFSTCHAEMTLSLQEGCERIDVRLSRTYQQRVHEGILTLPLPLEIGSYLGSYCERPYVPAFAVEHRMPYEQTSYTSDKPYGYAEARDTGDAWRTSPFRNFYAGISPFLGIDTAIAESPNGSMLLLTDGHNHFYRRQETVDQHEWLGLSLGASAIHPQTQLYKMPIGSPWEKIGRRLRTDHADAYDHCDFVAPIGTIDCSWSLLFSSAQTIDRVVCYQQRMERFFPAMPIDQSITNGFALFGDGVIISALESVGDGFQARLVNLTESPQAFTLRLPWEVTHVTATGDMPLQQLAVDHGMLTGTLPPYALREFALAIIR